MSRSSAISGGAPLVSVLMPVRGCRDTLPMAVASVLAQSLQDWELLVVRDDDEPGLEWLDRLGDDRIRVFRSGQPGGRGAARRAGLESARGEFLAFLDADDWMLPDRLARQTETLNADPELALVSGGMFVVDRDDALFGLRRLLSVAGAIATADDDLLEAPVLSASSMVRTKRARSIGYQREFVAGEDSDFLVRYLRGQRYLQEEGPVYVYREFRSFSAAGLRQGLAANRRRYVRQLHGLRRALALGKWAVKRLAYEPLLFWPGPDWIVGRRSRPASEAERARFEDGRRAVRAALDEMPAHS